MKYYYKKEITNHKLGSVEKHLMYFLHTASAHIYELPNNFTLTVNNLASVTILKSNKPQNGENNKGMFHTVPSKFL